MSLRALILIIMNSLIFLVILMLSLTFYNQFSKAMDERILLQLNSIKTLKKVQIENLIKSEWKAFLAAKTAYDNFDSLQIKLPKTEAISSGIYDFTEYQKEGKTTIVLVSQKNNNTLVKLIDYSKIVSILIERTGMGSSGESYLVGKDFHMRSP